MKYLRYKIIIIYLITALFCIELIYSQDNKNTASDIPFYLDVICFKGESDSTSRVDVFTVVPYESLNFIKMDDYYLAQYDIIIKSIDSNKIVKEEKRVHRNIKTQDYISAQGGTGQFDYSQTILNLPKGNYEFKIIMIDNNTNEISEKSRTLTVLKFSDFPFSISGILLLSSIEEQNGKFKITPYISDNVGDLKDGFFTFFESYNYTTGDSVDFVYQFVDKGGKIFETSKKIRKYVKNSKTQLYLKIPYNENISQGNYNLRIIALKPINDTIVKTEYYLAASERSIGYFRTMLGFHLDDLNKAVKQLRYIAQPDDIEYIDTVATQDEKQRRFKEFWDKQDPTPGTERNESFEEYYSRIDFANKEFKSYNEGWLTDMGMVYIIYGKPFQIERSAPGTIGRKVERWSYLNNRQFSFVDNSGFGDFRLYSPPTVTERYKYK
ncbi:MAG: GWxTD domain-containing protein [Ignavibacteriae bacterium]|nr:GWxTD domain-containing protein [Ignavibacteriota bacterium]